MNEPKIVKELRLGSCQVSVIDTDSYDPATQYNIEITGPFPSHFAGLPRSLMLRMIRALALMARQSAASASKDINSWASGLPGAGVASHRRAKAKPQTVPVSGQLPEKSTAAGSVKPAK